MSDAGPATRGIPPIAVSETSTLVTHTGSWKYIQPAYHDRVAPCNTGCPVGIDIEGYMRLLAEGRVAEAQDLLLAENPMPAVTGRVCHRPCEAACNRRWFDEAVSVHAVERMVGDLPGRGAAAATAPPRDEQIAVIGAGPAGLACAYHLARLGYGVTVFDAAAEPGGMLRLGIPEYRLPRAVLDREIDRIRALGVHFTCGVRVGSDVPWWSMLAEFHAVFVATGAHVGRPLGVPGEDAPDVRPGLEFLREVNHGGRPRLGRRVVVIGGGNTAIDCARTALRLGARVTVLYRRTRAEMPAIPDEVEEAEGEGVLFHFLAGPVGFRAADGRLSAVECVEMELGAPDASGRRQPVPTDRRFAMPADTVLTAIGEAIDLRSLPADLARGAAGLRVGPLGRTSRAAVFAGGDVTDSPRTVADALGAGKRAAIGIDRHLRALADAAGESLGPLRFGGRGNLSMTRWRDADPIPRTAPLNEVVAFEDLNPSHFQPRPRRPDRRLPAIRARAGFREVNRGLTRDAALDEARRCFNCGVCNRCDVCLIFCPDVAISRIGGDGAYHVALEYCKGCGICAAECPRGAILMTRDGP